MTATEWAAVLTALGIGATVREIGAGFWQWLTGRQDAEKARMRRVLDERDHAEADLRRLAEHASELRRLLIDHGTPSTDLPPWPISHDHHDKETS